MIYGYIRVSSDKQTVENQRFEINNFCANEGYIIGGWIEETVSGTCEPSKRRLGRLLRKVKKGDVIVCAELSRLGRNLFMIMEILNVCMRRGCLVWSIKDGYRLGDDIQSKVLAFAFGLSAEIERNLISQRTREALALRRAQGVRLGRPVGSHNTKSKYKDHANVMTQMFAYGHSVAEVANRFKVSRTSIYRWFGGSENIKKLKNSALGASGQKVQANRGTTKRRPCLG